MLPVLPRWRDPRIIATGAIRLIAAIVSWREVAVWAGFTAPAAIALLIQLRQGRRRGRD
jgi:hypothetical protein